jgi:hypothetical protein
MPLRPYAVVMFIASTLPGAPGRVPCGSRHGRTLMTLPALPADIQAAPPLAPGKRNHTICRNSRAISGGVHLSSMDQTVGLLLSFHRAGG